MQENRIFTMLSNMPNGTKTFADYLDQQRSSGDARPASQIADEYNEYFGIRTCVWVVNEGGQRGGQGSQGATNEGGQGGGSQCVFFEHIDHPTCPPEWLGGDVEA